MKYWYHKRCNIRRDNEKIPQKCRIINTCLTYLKFIGGKLYSANTKNTNHIYKDQNYLLSVIITFGQIFSGGETVFNCGIRLYDLG